MARQTYNQLWHFWGDQKFSRSLKLQIFEANVLSDVAWDQMIGFLPHGRDDEETEWIVQ